MRGRQSFGNRGRVADVRTALLQQLATHLFCSCSSHAPPSVRAQFEHPAKHDATNGCVRVCVCGGGTGQVRRVERKDVSIVFFCREQSLGWCFATLCLHEVARYEVPPTPPTTPIAMDATITRRCMLHVLKKISREEFFNLNYDYLYITHLSVNTHLCRARARARGRTSFRVRR